MDTAEKHLRDMATARTESIRQQDYITEIADAVSIAVATTSQTYVDALKNSGSFTKEAQDEAAKKALAACIASSISPAAQDFIESAYGDLMEYLKNRIEAEVRKQKLETPILVGTPVLETSADAASITVQQLNTQGA